MRRQGRRRTHTETIALGLVVASLAGVTSLRAAAAGTAITDVPTVDDGVYAGRVVMSGTVSYVPEELGPSGEAIMTWTGPMNGTAELTIDRGVASGSWSVAGVRTMSGTFAQDGHVITLAGTQDGIGSGTFTGSSGTYALDGAWTATTTVRMQGDGHALGGSGPDTDTIDLVLGLHDVLVTCDQLVGRFDRDLVAQVESGGFSASGITATVLLVRQPTAEETDEALDRLQTLLAQGLDWVSRAESAEAFGPEAVALLREVARAAAEVAATLEGPSPCPASQARYLELAADLARQALDALLDLQDAGHDIDSRWLWEVTANAVAAGLGGTPAGDDLLDRVRDEVADRFTDEVQAEPELDDPSSETLVLLSIAAGYGWDLPLTDGGTAPARSLLLGGR